MAPFLTRLDIGVKAFGQLGPLAVGQAALYRFGLWTGHYRRLTSSPRPEWVPDDLSYHFPFFFPNKSQLEAITGWQADELIQEADEICGGKIRLFGGEPVEINLAPEPPLAHWSAYERGKAGWGSEDVKLIWEPARFGWALTLGRAYIFSNNNSYAEKFWQLVEEFADANPPYQGPNWTSGQEVAIRIIMWAAAGQMFTDAPATTLQRKTLLAKSLAAHAARIPPTLVYARSQNNNHLLIEAAGLYTAGIILDELPQAVDWKRMGWQIFNQAIQKQIERNGTYVQHSLNYHRLMLQTGLWMQTLARASGITLPRVSQVRLAAATQWLQEKIDSLSGQAPNLGHNDGAYLFQLAPGGYADFRPVAQAASRAFLGQAAFPPGPWDEMSAWFNIDDDLALNPNQGAPAASDEKNRKSGGVVHGQDSWASLRAVKYKTRPGQCDQLHVDLWWKGKNLALDAGTYSYNAATPWENALADTAVHNTVQVDGRDQMLRAGRFLWLDWAQAFFLWRDSSTQKITGVHTGYRKIGVRHQRSLAYLETNHWQVTDLLLPVRPSPEHHSAALNWLLPDLPWELHGTTLRLKTEEGILSIRVALTNQTTAQTYVQLIRAGKVIAGPGTASPVQGWFSPTYFTKVPALSFRFLIEGVLPLSFSTDWFLP